jgi:hypothetical protein
MADFMDVFPFGNSTEPPTEYHMKLTPFPLVFLLLLSAPALAKDYSVVKVAKPGLSMEKDAQGRPYRNDIQFVADVGDHGKSLTVQLKFLWLMHVNASGSPEYVKAPASLSNKFLHSRFPVSHSNPRHAASCERAVPDAPCAYLSLTAPEIDWVKNTLSNKAIILRADKKNGRLNVGTYVEMNGKEVRLDAVVVTAENRGISIFPPSAEFVVKSVAVSTSEGPFNWPCVSNCHKQEGI